MLPAPCPSWSREVPHLPSSGLGLPYGNGAARGRRSQGSPIPAQAGAAWTSQDAPAAPSKPGAFPTQRHPKSLLCCPPHLGPSGLPPAPASPSRSPAAGTPRWPQPGPTACHTRCPTARGAAPPLVPRRRGCPLAAAPAAPGHGEQPVSGPRARPPACTTGMSANGVAGCCPAPGPPVSRMGCEAMPGLTFPGDVLLPPLPALLRKAGPGRQLTMACMPRGQACWRGAGGDTCVGQRARWGSAPWHRTLCTQKLFFWLRVFRLPRESSRVRHQLGCWRLSPTQRPCWVPTQGAPACPDQRALPGVGVLQLHVPELPAGAQSQDMEGGPCQPCRAPDPAPRRACPPQHPVAGAGAVGSSHGMAG